MLTIQCKMSKGTIESAHVEKLNFLKGNEEIEYLLDVAHVLETYGEQDGAQHHEEVHCTNAETHPADKLSGFVKVVGTQSKGSLYKEYMSIVNNEPATIIEHVNSYICSACNVSKVAIQNDAYMICPNCGCADVYFDSGTQGMSYDQEVNSEVNVHFAYKRINHFNEWIAQFQAKESTSIPEEIVDKLKQEFKKQRITNMHDITQNKIKQLLKKLSFNKYYEHVPHITNILNGIKPPTMTLHLEEQLRCMFRDIQAPFEKHKPKTRSNFLSYSYCLYKFCELLGKDEFLSCFQLLKSREKLYQQDSIWKDICEDMSWQYIPTV